MVERSDTTGIDGIKTSHPEGVIECGPEKRAVPSGIPAGMRRFCWGYSGYVAALNPRLMALIPPGSFPTRVVYDTPMPRLRLWAGALEGLPRMFANIREWEAPQRSLRDHSH